jgi:5-methylcytosine-specific restriction protein B
MGLISPKNKKKYIYFDKVPRVQVMEKLWSLIIASGWVSRETNISKSDRRKRISERLKDTFNIAQEDGARTYGQDETKLNDQFQKQYTIGWDLGIWKNESLELSDVANEVFEGRISIRDYITRFCVNLFEYIEGIGYIHPLYLTCEYAINNEKTTLSKEDFYTLFFNQSSIDEENHDLNEHVKMWMNYLAATYLFEKNEQSRNYSLSFTEKFSPHKIKEFCNLEYSENDRGKTEEYFKNAKNYADYISQRVKDDFYINLLNLNSKGQNNLNRNIDQPHQMIFSGAPGTGKSYKLKEMANYYFSDNLNINYERITFHNNMNYGHFVGVYKPFPSDDPVAPITYKFVPGVLLRQLINAYKNPSNNYLILIEEINRANTASVFGDIFQLLDRTEGVSDYPITISEDILLYLKEENLLSENNNVVSDEVRRKLINEGLYFPQNLYIWSSMNEADQGVMPLDTAFKRRWNFKKFGVNDLGEKGKEFFSDKTIKNINGNINWNDLRIAINKKLLSLNIPEGKLMGPYFIARENLLDNDRLTDTFLSNVLMYLFEDAVKTRPTSLFNLEPDEKHYEALVAKFKKQGLKVFNDIDYEEYNYLDLSERTDLSIKD